ncbi:MSHA biogenesis protein MshF [Vibrio europaeus]|uniref:MSHA biogenesis protein MshF n=1 Tax=Vibrio europaeus TaxID=300876 RepID=UPI002341772F|nr:MSHA biogenesis protein MshF [Vibrio europaeus]MDC5847640.1 MSHA biogenesis protein MshF [Vibrio europaeus]
MPLKANLISYIERSRFAIWLLVIVCLIMSFTLVWQSVVKEANQSAFLLASQRIVERASYYKQQWLLSGQQNEITIEGRTLNYTSMGWIKPLGDRLHVDCLLWLDTLYPQHEVLGNKPVAVENKTTANNYHCDYLYSDDRLISITLMDNRFIAKTGFLAQ